LIWILFLVVTGGVIAYFVSSYRKKVAEREAASKKRFEEMFLAQPKPAPAHTPEMSPASVPSAGAPPVIKTAQVANSPPVAVAALPARERAPPIACQFRGLRVSFAPQSIKRRIADP